MKRLLWCLLLVSVNVFAQGKMTQLSPGVTIYSEYYPNPNAQFKGTIIFENGSGTDLNEWKSNKQFFDCVRKLGSVLIYDRNGLGKSPPDLRLSPSNLFTAKFVSDKLTNLITQLQIKPPYLFVSHSYGAVFTSYFVLKNPKLIKGILFVDPVPRDFHFTDQLLQKHKAGMDLANVKPAQYIYEKYSGAEAESIYQMLGFNATMASLKHFGNIDNAIPVVILSSTEMSNGHPITEDWFTSQKQWLNQNPMSKIIKVPSNHFIHIEKPLTVCNTLAYIISNS